MKSNLKMTVSKFILILSRFFKYLTLSKFHPDGHRRHYNNYLRSSSILMCNIFNLQSPDAYHLVLTYLIATVAQFPNLGISLSVLLFEPTNPTYLGIMTPLYNKP